MGEVSAMFDANASQIRFYEKQFDVLQPKKNAKGNRLFTPQDMDNLKIIFDLLKNKGYTLQGAKDVLNYKGNETRNRQQVINSLERLKQFLLEVHDQL